MELLQIGWKKNGNLRISVYYKEYLMLLMPIIGFVFAYYLIKVSQHIFK